ncbi:MAG: hypothetical protein MN733_03595, partial [Nitrososphaera sp.]|nr:hypothetical protein [Nitrososphaera sp.]
MTHTSDLHSKFESLQKSLGGVRYAPDRETLRALWDSKDHTGLLGSIACHMHVDLKLIMAFVRKGGPQGALAWVQLPQPMPHYGSRAYKGLKITVYIRNDFLVSAPFETVVY